MSEKTPELVSLHPVLAVTDLAQALAYYRDRLGFDVTWEWGSPPVRAGVGRDGLEIQLDFNPQALEPAPSNVYVHMTGVEAFYRQCVERGAEITSPLEERPWRMKDFRVVDPSGNRLGFGEPL